MRNEEEREVSSSLSPLDARGDAYVKGRKESLMDVASSEELIPHRSANELDDESLDVGVVEREEPTLPVEETIETNSPRSESVSDSTGTELPRSTIPEWFRGSSERVSRFRKRSGSHGSTHVHIHAHRAHHRVHLSSSGSLSGVSSTVGLAMEEDGVSSVSHPEREGGGDEEEGEEGKRPRHRKHHHKSHVVAHALHSLADSLERNRLPEVGIALPHVGFSLPTLSDVSSSEDVAHSDTLHNKFSETDLSPASAGVGPLSPLHSVGTVSRHLPSSAAGIDLARNHTRVRARDRSIMSTRSVNSIYSPHSNIPEVAENLFTTHEMNTMEPVPPSVFWSSLILSYNALFLAILELILEILLFSGAIPKVPFRIDFVFLTAGSAVLAYQTLRGVRGRRLYVTSDAIQISLLVEIALVVGDFFFLYAVDGVDFSVAIIYRSPFIALTLINIMLLFFITFRLHLWGIILRFWKPHEDEVRTEDVDTWTDRSFSFSLTYSSSASEISALESPPSPTPSYV